MNDSVLKLEKMIVPTLLKFIYVFLALGITIRGVINIFNNGVVSGLMILVLGNLGLRIFCESLIIIFNIYNKLTSVNRNLISIKDQLSEK